MDDEKAHSKRADKRRAIFPRPTGFDRMRSDIHNLHRRPLCVLFGEQ